MTTLWRPSRILLTRSKNPFGTKGALLYRGQALYVRSARQTARTIDVRAVLRHSVPNKGLHPLRRCGGYPLNYYRGGKSMSVMCCIFVPEGIIMAADSRLTRTRTSAPVELPAEEGIRKY